jgi:hypothetical protein
LLSAAGLYFKDYTGNPALLLALSAFILSQVRGRALFLSALCFWLFWTGLRLGLSKLGLTSELSPMPLAFWLALGLHLLLVWTPLSLARAFFILAKPLLGTNLASKISIAILVIVKVVPCLIQDAFRIKRTLEQRASSCSFPEKLALWGRSLVRITLSRNEELARALSKR